jgi:sugar phosphate isomerase/epimerase
LTRRSVLRTRLSERCAMPTFERTNSTLLHRRDILKAGVAGLPAMAWHGVSALPASTPVEAGKPTRFLLACMTLPYSQFPLERALSGIKSAGYSYVAWGTTHREKEGKEVPVIAPDAPPARARELAARCRDLGLAPLMMFSGIYPEAKDAVEILTSRIRQASAAGVPQVLTFGHTEGSDRRVWVERFKKLGPIARDQGVMIVIKQHGGNTGTGAACAEIVREVADEGVKVNYDAGNVMDYLDVDPISDIKKCSEEIRSFCIKDHRNFPADEDCGPGLGEIDHYRLLHTVAFTGLKMPLCCENIFAPVIPRPADPSGVDALARRAREFLEIVVSGLQA